MKETVFVFGAGGHAKAVIDVIEKQDLYRIVFLVDDDPALKGEEFFGYPVIGGKKDLLTRSDPPPKAIVAIGDNIVREKVSSWLSENGFIRICAVHPSAQIGRGVDIGAGTVIMAGACINADTVIGENVIVNTHASIDHDCKIGNNVHVAPSATLCGEVSVGVGTFLCAGATIIQNIKIGMNVTIGAGSTVIRDVQGGLTVVGSPGKPLKT